MARLAIGLGGAALGFAIGGPLGARIGFGAGLIVGGLLFPTVVKTQGPRLDDRRVQVSTIGLTVPRLHGTYEFAGNVIWLKGNQIDEQSQTEELGGKGGVSQEHTTFAYTATIAIGLCEGPIGGVLAIKGDGKLIADFRSTNTGPQSKYSNAKFRIYTGTTTQEPDFAIQSDKGVANAPAYRGLAYVVIEDLPLEDFGNRIPNITVTAFSEGTDAFPIVTTSGFASLASTAEQMRRGPDGMFYGRDSFNTGLICYNPLLQQVLYDATVTANGFNLADLGGSGALAISADGRRVYFGGANSSAGRISVIELPSLVITGVLGTASLTPGDYQMGGAPTQIFWGGRRDSEGAIVSQRISGFTPTSNGHTVYSVSNVNNFLDVGCIGHIRTTRYNVETDAPETYPDAEIEESNIGWLCFDTDTIAYCMANNSTTVKIYAFDWTQAVQVKKLLYTEPPGTPPCLSGVFSGDADYWRNSAPLPCPGFPIHKAHRRAIDQEGFPVDVSASILSFNGTEDIRCTYVQELHAVLFLHANYAYLFDIASRTIIGDGLLVTTGGSFTNLDTTMRGGVGPDGKIVFKHTSSTLTVLDVVAWTVETQKYDLADWGSLGTTRNGGGYVPELNAWLGVTRPNGHLVYFDRSTDGSKPLDEVVSEELQEAGLIVPEIDVSALSTDNVRGYLIANQNTSRQIIEPLARVHAFDLVETDGKLKAIVRGGATSFAIPEDDLGAYPAGGERPISLLESRAAERTLPLRIDLAYAGVDRAYQRSTQNDQRISEVTSTNEVASIETGEALSDDEAKQVARRILAETWEAAQRYEMTVGQKYLRLDPADRGTLTRGTTTHTLRLTETNIGADWMVSLKGVRDRGQIYTQTATGTAIAAVTDTFAFVDTSVLFLLDIPSLRDIDNVFGLYYAAGPKYNDANWPGARVQDSDDNASFERLGEVASGVAYGYAQAALGDITRWTVVDQTSTIDVVWINGDDPVTVTNAVFLANGSVYLIGDEIVLVRDVTDNGDGTFTFSHLLRGRLGTEDKISTHVAGERVIRLDEDTIRRANTDVVRYNVSRFFKVNTLGQTFPSTAVQSFTNTGRSVMPYAPFFIRVNRESNNDLTIRWEYRTQLFDNWNTNLVTSGSDAGLEFSVDFINGSGDVVRTVYTSDVSYTYARVQQIEDGLGTGIGHPVTNITSAITNPSAESGGTPPTGWTTESGSWLTNNEGSTPAGSLHFTSASIGLDVVHTLRQTIDLAAAGISTASIDSNAINLRMDYLLINLRPGLENENTEDLFRAGIRMKNAGSVVTHSFFENWRNPVHQWTRNEFSVVVPSGTRYVDLVFSHHEIGNDTRNIVFDDVRLFYGPPGTANMTIEVFEVSTNLGSPSVRGIGRRVTV